METLRALKFSCVGLHIGIDEGDPQGFSAHGLSVNEGIYQHWDGGGISVPLQSVIEWMRPGVQLEYLCKGSWGMAFSVLSWVAGGCGVNIYLVDSTVLVSSTKYLLVEWGVGFTIDQPENPLLPSVTSHNTL